MRGGRGDSPRADHRQDAPTGGDRRITVLSDPQWRRRPEHDRTAVVQSRAVLDGDLLAGAGCGIDAANTAVALPEPITFSPGAAAYGQVDELLTIAPTEPGVYEDLSENAYHADLNALSSSQARRLWLGVSPRQFRHEQLNGTRDSDTLEYGRAVHTLTLHQGPPVVEVNAKDWKTKRAQQLRTAYRAAGAIPLLTQRYAEARAMATSARTHPTLAPLFDQGWAEVSFYWRDPDTGLMLRTRPDWLHPTADGGITAVELKTADSADPEDFAWSVLRYGYHLQQSWYQHGLAAHGLSSRLLFAVISKQPPHVVTVCELDRADLVDAAHQNRRAINLYARCLAADRWPDYGPGIHRIRVPRRATLRYRPR
ncbi:PD-(D/E)XK nuclease-like domain-containing protein [Nocardia farcinica]|uniref:PD-(D/E)XK nuclease-like domain-containing protein n=1 Tax=Nocardia farcinica TaxID=37329 RepID=UPI001E5B9AFB|nr:PD-(D/E)XK nuclease-like domain-containing protein [Nocardia farcinica]UEX20764.1 PD-(D/E)XK nuclease-like domain-containing protein [Nocardia farcinica]